MSLSTIPFKQFYSLEEAQDLISKSTGRTDIDKNYFLMMGLKGFIRIAIQPSSQQVEQAIGGVFFDDAEQINNIQNDLTQAKTISSIATAFDVTHVLLIISDDDLMNIFYYESLSLSDTTFNNVYSILNDKFYISDEYLNDLAGFKYSDKLASFELYSPAIYSEKQNKIVIASQDEHGNYLHPEERNHGDDWQILFFPNYNVVNRSKQEIFSNRTISLNDLYVFGEDLELLITGEKREKFEERRSKAVERSKNTHKNLLHPRRENSLLKIIYALAHKASLDFTHPHTIYSELAKYCELEGIELPRKDTTANILKKAFEEQ